MQSPPMGGSESCREEPRKHKKHSPATNKDTNADYISIDLDSLNLPKQKSFSESKCLPLGPRESTYFNSHSLNEKCKH